MRYHFWSLVFIAACQLTWGLAALFTRDQDVLKIAEIIGYIWFFLTGFVIYLMFWRIFLKVLGFPRWLMLVLAGLLAIAASIFTVFEVQNNPPMLSEADGLVFEHSFGFRVIYSLVLLPMLPLGVNFFVQARRARRQTSKVQGRLLGIGYAMVALVGLAFIFGGNAQGERGFLILFVLGLLLIVVTPIMSQVLARQQGEADLHT